MDEFANPADVATAFAVDADEMNAAFEKLAAPTPNAERDMRRLGIATRWPALSPDVVDFAAEHDLSDGDIAGALWMMQTKPRRDRAFSDASKRWSVPCAGKRRSLKSKRR